jgi:hypothetical protein
VHELLAVDAICAFSLLYLRIQKSWVDGESKNIYIQIKINKKKRRHSLIKIPATTDNERIMLNFKTFLLVEKSIK